MTANCDEWLLLAWEIDVFVISFVESTEDDSPLRVLPSPLPDLENVERVAKQRVMNREVPGAGGYVVYDEAADGLEVARWYQAPESNA